MTGNQRHSDSTQKLNQRVDLDFALQAAGLGVWELDPATNQIVWDDRCRELFGLAKDNYLPYEQAIRHIHPEDRSRVDQAVQRAMNPQEDGIYDQTYRTIGADDGKLRWVRFYGQGYFNEVGEVYRFAGVAQEVTAQILAKQREAISHQQAQRQQRIYQAITASTPDLMYVFDLNYRFTYANEALLAMWGKSWDMAIGKNLLENGYELWHARMHEREIDQVVATKQLIRGEVSFPHATLGKRIYDYVFAPVLNDQGEVEAVAGTTRDITDIKQAQERIRESEDRFRSLVAQAPVATCLFVGSELVIEVANEPMIRFFGQGPGIVGQPVRAVLTATQADTSAIALLEQVFATGKSFTAQAAPAELTIDGVSDTYYFDLSLKPLCDPSGAVYAVLETATDVTQQVLARREAEANHQQFRTLLESIPQMTWTHNTNGEVTFYNERWYAYTGLDFSQTRDLDWQAVVHPDDLQQTMANVQESVRVGGIFMVENRYRRADGQYRWHLNRAIPLYDEQGQLTQWVGTATDIHEQKQLAAELERQVHLRTSQLQASVADLRRSNDNLQQFAYVASHDLQEPLRKIQSFGDMLHTQYGGQLGAMGGDYLSRMQASATRMSTLIRDLLSYSRISTQADSSALVDLNRVVKQVLTDLELVVEESKALIDADALPTLDGDASQLGQLFQNLLGNALKFRQANRAPRIHIRHQEIEAADLPALVKPTRMAQRYHCLTVSDNGIGFDEQYKDRIFQVFQRLHGKSQYSGTGIGLAICEKVVANHGGAITAHSQPGQGASFRVYLPA